MCEGTKEVDGQWPESEEKRAAGEQMWFTDQQGRTQAHRQRPAASWLASVFSLSFLFPPSVCLFPACHFTAVCTSVNTAESHTHQPEGA